MQKIFVTYDNQTIAYTIERSKRKSISIAVLRDGQVVIKVPQNILQSTIDEIIRKKQNWILSKKLEIMAQNEMKERMDYLSYQAGSNLLYEGKLYPLMIHYDKSNKQSVVKFTGTSFELFVNNEDAMFIRSLMRAWYRENARLKFQERVTYYNTFLKLTYGTIRIKEQKGCYGSCSAKGNLNFNWKCILAPSEILDYVVVHELCHLRYFNHSKQFWDLVSRLMPDYKEKIKWIKKNGRLLEY